MHLGTIDDLTLDEIDRLFERGREFERDGADRIDPFRAALVFLSSSLRTRVGFTVAVQRLGGSTVDIHEPRYSQGMSSAESVSDLLRTVSGMVDLVVLRSDEAIESLDLSLNCVSAFVNAGDAFHHPTQTLIDAWSIEEELGDVAGLHVVMLGDTTMRAARSMLMYFRRRPPRRLTLIAPERRLGHGVDLGARLGGVTATGTFAELRDADLVYVIGLAPGQADDRLDDEERRSFQLSQRWVASMPTGSVVLDPMPLIDEICDDVRDDPRMRFWAQSDRSVAMRMAVIERLMQKTRA